MKTNLRTGKPFETGTIPTNIWEGNLVTASQESKESSFHPTVKPQFVLQRMIQAYSNENDIVLDCFSGSGSTMIACSETNRQFVGSELDKEYFEKSVSRYKENHSTLFD
jgi:DNA modification methylase